MELSLTHEYTVPLPPLDSLPEEIAPAPDVTEDSVFESDVQGSVIASSESDSIPQVLRNQRGRIIKPPRAHVDFLPF